MSLGTLFTAFKGANNTSYQLVTQTGQETLLLTNSFSGLERDINSLENNYNTVYMFGVDKKLKSSIKIEKCAQKEENIICTQFDVSALSKLMVKHNVLHQVSSTPTQFLCNSAYYLMLSKNKNTVFIHIPSLRGMTEDLMNKLINLFRDIQ